MISLSSCSHKIEEESNIENSNISCSKKKVVGKEYKYYK